MRVEYLRHEYTWSDHGITGNKLGWGFTASSVPEDRERLNALEKVAAAACPERETEVRAEEFLYSEETGYVKLTVEPCGSGEDQRQNKRVRLYQAGEEMEAYPAALVAPGADWGEEARGSFLSPLVLSVNPPSVEAVLNQWKLYDRLPEFFSVLGECLCGNRKSVNFTAPSWKPEEYAARAAELMGAVMELLPPALRRRCSYRSYCTAECSHAAFWFSPEPVGEVVWNLEDGGTRGVSAREDALEDYFYYHLARCYVENRALYDAFSKETEKFLAGEESGGNTLRKLQWIFYGLCSGGEGETLPEDYLLSQYPQLAFWAKDESALASVERAAAAAIRASMREPEDMIRGVKVLSEGCTARGIDAVGREILWLLEEICKKDSALCMEQVIALSEQDGMLSEKLLARMSPALKNEVMREGIHLLNRDLFVRESYLLFDGIVEKMHRQKQWGVILKDLAGQMAAQMEAFDEEQMEAARTVEQLLKKNAPEAYSGVIEQRWEEMQKEVREKAEEDPREEARDAAHIEEAAGTMETARAEQSAKGGLFPFLLNGIPQGFLTGCAMYLSSYSRMIGHWKIALGMTGMWLLLMLNYIYLMKHRADHYALWKSIGVCLLEGYVIETVAMLFLSQRIRLYYFVALGIATLLVQLYLIWQKGREET